MKNVLEMVNPVSCRWSGATSGRVALMLLAGLLLTACGQGSSTDSADQAGPAAESAPAKGLLSGAALNSAHQAADSLEQKAMAETVRITQAVGQSAAQSEEAAQRRLLEASKKTDEQMRQAAAQAGNSQ